MTSTVPETPRSHESVAIAHPTDRDTVASRVFRAPRERVFRLFTDRATLPKVWAPDPSRVTIEEDDFRPGGRFALLVKGDDGGSVCVSGEFLDIVPPAPAVT